MTVEQNQFYESTMPEPTTAAKPELPTGLYKCQFCGCLFCTIKDLEHHRQRFGYTQESHIDKHQRTHLQVERY